MELIIKLDCGKTVHSTNEWKELCPPLGHSNQWVDKRSAKELAKSVFETGTLPEIINEVLSDMNISLPSEMRGIPKNRQVCHGRSMESVNMIYGCMTFIPKLR